ncbi:MAG: DNA polymerase III subunit beta [Candidatus Taylorbacteria bacterium]|nr:DNA polymerase III subunit beta [Candidatus Taylorbacteria bacterium]
MNIECVQEKLKEAVGYADRIANKHTTLPVLSCLLFDASQKNQLTIKATNLDLGIEISVPIKTNQEGVVAVPSSTINSFLMNAVGDEKAVVIETSQGNLKINTTRNSGVIKIQPHEDFPSIPRVPSTNSFSLNSPDFVKGLKSVWYSSSVSSIKPELSSVYIYCEGEFVVFVATDSFRLAEKKIKIKKTKDFGQILLPYKNIPEIIKILESINNEVLVNLDKNQISFSYKGIYLVSRVIDGVFPDYKQIIPKSSSTEVVVLKQDFVNTLKLSNVFSDKFNQINIKVDPSAKKSQIKTKNNDIGENTTVLDSAVTGEAIDINFNYKYIIDCLQSIDSDSVNLIFSGLNKPVIITPVSDTTFRYIVMPMNR